MKCDESVSHIYGPANSGQELLVYLSGGELVLSAQKGPPASEITDQNHMRIEGLRFRNIPNANAIPICSSETDPTGLPRKTYHNTVADRVLTSIGERRLGRGNCAVRLIAAWPSLTSGEPG